MCVGTSHSSRSVNNLTTVDTLVWTRRDVQMLSSGGAYGCNKTMSSYVVES